MRRGILVIGITLLLIGGIIFLYDYPKIGTIKEYTPSPALEEFSQKQYNKLQLEMAVSGTVAIAGLILSIIGGFTSKIETPEEIRERPEGEISKEKFVKEKARPGLEIFTTKTKYDYKEDKRINFSIKNIGDLDFITNNLEVAFQYEGEDKVRKKESKRSVSIKKGETKAFSYPYVPHPTYHFPNEAHLNTYADDEYIGRSNTFRVEKYRYE
jgi:hypothetical protein